MTAGPLLRDPADCEQKRRRLSADSNSKRYFKLAREREGGREGGRGERERERERRERGEREREKEREREREKEREREREREREKERERLEW